MTDAPDARSVEALALEGVDALYEDSHVLHGVSFALQRGHDGRGRPRLAHGDRVNPDAARDRPLAVEAEALRDALAIARLAA